VSDLLAGRCPSRPLEGRPRSLRFTARPLGTSPWVPCAAAQRASALSRRPVRCRCGRRAGPAPEPLRRPGAPGHPARRVGRSGVARERGRAAALAGGRGGTRTRVLHDWASPPGRAAGWARRRCSPGPAVPARRFAAEVIAGDLGRSRWSANTSSPMRTSAGCSTRPRTARPCCRSTRRTRSSASGARCATGATATQPRGRLHAAEHGVVPRPGHPYP
jgi:hypothetical protein